MRVTKYDIHNLRFYRTSLIERDPGSYLTEPECFSRYDWDYKMLSQLVKLEQDTTGALNAVKVRVGLLEQTISEQQRTIRDQETTIRSQEETIDQQEKRVEQISKTQEGRCDFMVRLFL